MTASFVREKQGTFPIMKEKELFDTLKKYPEMGEININDLRNPEARWWQEVLYVLAKKSEWVGFDEKEFMAVIQSAPPGNRYRVLVQLLVTYWIDIGQIALVRPPIEILDFIRPTKQRVFQILSGFINLDLFVNHVQQSAQFASFRDILNQTSQAEEHIVQLQKRIKELEEVCERKRDEAARNEERRFQIRCDLDKAANELQTEKEALERWSRACDEKEDAYHLLETKIEENERKTGTVQSEIDRLSYFLVPDVEAFIKQPIHLRSKLDTLMDEAARATRQHAEQQAEIQACNHLDEELRTCLAILERDLKFAKELEEAVAQLNAVEEEVASLQAESKMKVEERNHLSTVIATSQQRKRRPVNDSKPSKPNDADNVDEGEMKGRQEEGDALMKLLIQREALRQQVFAKSRELDIRYHESRDRLAANHDQFIDFIRGMMNELVVDGLMPPPSKPEGDQENELPSN